MKKLTALAIMFFIASALVAVAAAWASLPADSPPTAVEQRALAVETVDSSTPRRQETDGATTSLVFAPTGALLVGDLAAAPTIIMSGLGTSGTTLTSFSTITISGEICHDVPRLDGTVVQMCHAYATFGSDPSFCHPRREEPAVARSESPVEVAQR